MLKYDEICKKVDEKYHEMIKQVNIVDFTKCIAQFSGLQMNEVSDDAICQYLTTWAKNKYRFYLLLNRKLIKDIPITYVDEKKDMTGLMRDLETEYPIYSMWIDAFAGTKSNKISTNDYYFRWDAQQVIRRAFPNCSIDGCSLTHFFKTYLKAPDELVTAIGRLFENEKIEANYTISIDPVDMMLASENPYNWVSCYRIEVPNSGSHGDGCLAAILDNSSLITYVWNKEGKFKLYEKYEFKNIRYKRMRQWISINPDSNMIYFNDIYPGKDYSTEFYKMLRIECENFVNKDATWVRVGKEVEDHCADELVERVNLYGYNEFSGDMVYKIKGVKTNYWTVYNEEIVCPCGCGGYLPGSDDEDCEDEYEFNGEGFTLENYVQKHYCEYCDDYCSDEDCSDCHWWNEAHPVCELDESTHCDRDTCEAEDEDLFDSYESNIVHCSPEFCEHCPHYAEHIKNMKQDLREED